MAPNFDSFDFAAIIAAAGLATAAGMASGDSQGELQYGYPLVAQDAGALDIGAPPLEQPRA